MRTYFFTFEGIDGSGKDSQLLNLVSYMKQYDFLSDKYTNIWITREPTMFTTSGRNLSKMLKEKTIDNKQAYEYFVNDRIEHSKEIKRILKHSHVLSSRYDLSTFMYQLQETNNIEDVYLKHKFGENPGSIIPDLTVVFSISADVALKRINARKKDKVEAYENYKFLDQCVKNQEKVISWWKKNHPERKFLLVNADNTKEGVFEEMIEGIKGEML